MVSEKIFDPTSPRSYTIKPDIILGFLAKERNVDQIIISIIDKRVQQFFENNMERTDFEQLIYELAMDYKELKKTITSIVEREKKRRK